MIDIVDIAKKAAICSLLAFVIGYTPVTWVMNLVKFSECDFEAPYKCEIIHGAGLIPMAAWVTAWMDMEEPQ
jgi:hypothetical protein